MARVELNRDVVREILNSKGVDELIEDFGDQQLREAVDEHKYRYKDLVLAKKKTKTRSVFTIVSYIMALRMGWEIVKDYNADKRKSK